MPDATPPRPIQVLLVDDEPANLLALEAVLHELGATLVRAGSGEEALKKAYDGDFAAILLDVRMPGMDGFETARLLRSRQRSRTTPIIFVTASDSAEFSIEEAYSMGAVDYLTKPLMPAVIKGKVQFFMELYRSREELRLAEREQARREEAEATAERLRASEERYRTLFESIDEGFCLIEVLLDASGRCEDYRYLEINPAFEKQSGLKDAAGRTIREMVPGHDDHWFEIFGRIVRTGEPVRVLDEAKAMGRWFDVYATRAGGPGSRNVAVLFTDVTERKLADEGLRRLAAELAESDRRKTEFLATLAHELRNPLAPVRNGLHVMKLAASNPLAVEKTREMMERQVTHIVRLIDDLLDIARVSTGKVDLKKERVDLKDVVANAVETSQPLIEGSHHRLAVRLPDEPLPLEVDPTRLAQVLSNLLNNAAKYTPTGGSIEVTARRDGTDVVISVTDSGIGIPEESLAQVFQMFTQVGRNMDRSQGGLGIGLSLVRGLVELHGGAVTATSAGPGRGSTFSVRLPLLSADTATTGLMPGSAGDAAMPQGFRVLVVDDNTDAAESLAMILQMSGHVARVAHDGDQAVKVAREFKPQIVFLDIGMPGKNGYEVARELRQTPAARDSVLVALTGWGAEDDRARSRAAGFDHHLTKPADFGAVEQLLAGVER